MPLQKLWAPFKVTLNNTQPFLGAAYLATVLMSWAAKNSTDLASIQGVVIFNFTMKRFFRMIAPANLVAALLVLIYFWNISVTVRIYSGMALALYVCVDVFTFTYFYSRNKILF